jgi:hypothetical protein
MAAWTALPHRGGAVTLCGVKPPVLMSTTPATRSGRSSASVQQHDGRAGALVGERRIDGAERGRRDPAARSALNTLVP